MSYGATETTTLVTTGMLPSLMLAAAALTAPVSMILIRLYRRAVVRGMAKRAEAGAEPPAEPSRAAPPASPPAAALTVRLIEPTSALSTDPLTYRQARRSLTSAAVVYTVAGLAYALVLTSAWLTFTGDEGFVLSRFLWLMSCYGWPTALALGMIAAVSRGQRALVILGYFAMLFAVAIYGLLRNAELNPAQLVFFWLFTNAPATVLLLAFLHRRVRAVGPLVLAFMAVAVIGSQVLLSAVGSHDAALHATVAAGSVFGLGGRQMFFVLILMGFVLFGIVGWWLLKHIGRLYEERKMSDQSLTLDAMWLLFGVVQSITLAFEGWLWIFTGIAAFGLYKVLVRLGFRILHPASDVEGPTLLLLRVFALAGRSERLFDALSKRWLRAGSISMIAGPDLLASTVEPREFLEFMGGRLSRMFIRDASDLEQRVRAMDCGPDPDGRYRVNEFFCYADTWKECMKRLGDRADTVLMDLRSFSASNQGCVFEVQQLVDSVPLERVVFLVDDTTDRAFLEQALQNAWRGVHPDSPNRGARAPEARLLNVPKQRATEVRGLLKLLFGSADFRSHAPALRT